MDQRCKALHVSMKNYYKEYAIDSQMPLLKASMLYKDKKKSSSSTSPKLRAKAGEAKGLILSRKLALASWSCSCFSKLSDGVDAPQKPQIID